MTEHEQLIQEYEDVLFSLLMYETVKEEGKEILEKSERLKNDPAAAIPHELDKRFRETIDREFAKKEKTEKSKKIIRFTGKFINRVAVAALVASLLFATVYAAVPSVRVKTLNLLIEASEVATKLSLVSEVGSTYGGVDIGKGASTSSTLLFGYSLPEVPEGFYVSNSGKGSMSEWIEYTDGDGAYIYIDIYNGKNIYIDTENAQSIEQMEINGYQGMVVEKSDDIHVVWADTDNSNFVDLICTGMTRSMALNIAEQIIFSE